MSASKAQVYLDLLDAARCNGDWDAVPELVRKLTKHAGTTRKCVTETALLDYDLSPKRLTHSQHKNGTIVASSSSLSRSVAISGTSGAAAPSTLITLIQLAKALEEEIARFKTENSEADAEGDAQPHRKRHLHRNKAIDRAHTSTEDIYQAEVTLAYLHHLNKSPKLVLQSLPKELPSINTITQEWTRVCSIKAICLRGLALEALKRRHDALEVYKSLQLPGNGPENSGEASYWSKKVLARFAMLSWIIYKNEDDADQAPYIEDFDFEAEDIGEELDQIGEDPASPGVRVVTDDLENMKFSRDTQQHKSLTEEDLIGAFRAYHAFSTSISAQRPVAPISAQSITTFSAARMTKDDEASRKAVYKLYLHVLSSSIKTSIDERTEIPTEMFRELKTIENIYEDLLLKTTTFPRAEEVNHEVLNWVDCIIDNWRNLGYQGSEAPRIVEMLYRASQKTFHSPRILRYLFYLLTACGNFHDARLSLDTYITIITSEKERLAKGPHTNTNADFDNDGLILTTVVTGIRFLVKYFDDQAPRAVELALLVKAWVFDWKVEDPEIVGAVWRGIGLANVANAEQTVETNQRSEIQEKAVVAFRKALTYTPDSMDLQFDFALALAQIREIDDAVIAVQLVIQEESLCVPAWHLLILLLTARQEWETAFTMTEAVFALMTEENEMNLGTGYKEGLLEVKITQMAILEVVEGPESAVNLADELLSLYARLFPGVVTMSDKSTPLSPTSPTFTNGKGRPITATTQNTAGPTIQVTDTSEREKHHSHHLRGHSLSSTLKRKPHSVDSFADPHATDHSHSDLSSNVTPNKHVPNTNNSQQSIDDSPRGKRASLDLSTNATSPSQPRFGGESFDTHPHNLPTNDLPNPLQMVKDDRPLLNRPKFLREPALTKVDEQLRIMTALKRIWLVIAGLYRRAEMWEDANVAIVEAGNLAKPEDVDVLAERGLLAHAQLSYDAAKLCFETALSYNPNHADSIIGLSQLLLLDEKDIAACDRASGLLSGLTKSGEGWDVSEAWFELATCWERGGQREKAAEILWWCVKLEDTRPVRKWRNIRPRVL